MSKVLVMGAAGFLGRSFLSAAASAGHDTVAAVRRPTRAVRALAGAVTKVDARTLRAEDVPTDVGVVINFATATEGDAEAMSAAAVEMATNALAAAREAGVPKVVHVSSMSAHAGPVASDASVPGGYSLEPHPERRGAYALSKTRAEEAVVAAARELAGPELVVVRPGLVFGREMKDPLAGTAMMLPLGVAVGLGRPEQAVPWIDVDDLNEALIRIVEQPATRGAVAVYDLLSGTPSKRDLLTAYHRLTGQPARSLWLPLPVPLLAAVAFDVMRHRPGRTSYAVRRMYRFEPRDLDADAAWRRLDAAPAAELRASVLRAITPEPLLDAATDDALRERAAALLRVEHPVSMASRRRVVLVGAGRIVDEMHLPALAELPEIEIAAVVDPRPDAVLVIAERVGAQAFDALDDVPDDLLSGSVTVVATPGASHADLAVAALERGASVLLEKPAALTLAGFERVKLAEEDAGSVVSVFHNYRLRPPALALWRFVLEHDVGPLVRTRVTFASPPIRNERARWMHDERLSRALLYEMAVHFVDLAAVAGGPLTELDTFRMRLSANRLQTISFTGSGRLEACDDFHFDFDLSGTAPGVEVRLEFARAVCALDFYPDGFRVLPRKPNPLDDAAAAIVRLGDAVRNRARRDRTARRARPHELIYREHLRRLTGHHASSPFSLDGVEPTMTSLQVLADALYDEAAVSA